MRISPQIAAALSAATLTVVTARRAATDGERKDDAENNLVSAAGGRSPRVSERDMAGTLVSEKYAGRKLMVGCANCHLNKTGGRGLTISGLVAGACPLDETGEPQILDDDEVLSEEALADCCTDVLDDETTRKWTAAELRRFLQEDPDHNITDADWAGLGWNAEALVDRCADADGAAEDAGAGAPTSGTAGHGGGAGAVATSTALFSTLVLVELFRSR